MFYVGRLVWQVDRRLVTWIRALVNLPPSPKWPLKVWCVTFHIIIWVYIILNIGEPTLTLEMVGRVGEFVNCVCVYFSWHRCCVGRIGVLFLLKACIYSCFYDYLTGIWTYLSPRWINVRIVPVVNYYCVFEIFEFFVCVWICHVNLKIYNSLSYV